jgi:hypothetical protein
METLTQTKQNALPHFSCHAVYILGSRAGDHGTVDVWYVTSCSLVKVRLSLNGNSLTMTMKAGGTFLSGCTTSQPTGTNLHLYY